MSRADSWSQRTLSARDRLQAALARIDATDARVNAFTEVTRERAWREAEAIDARRARGEALGPLAGMPYAVKNLFDIEGMVTLAGSTVNRDLPAASQDAVLVQRLRDAGAVLVGALNMDEYAYGFTTENTHYGPTHNPHRHGHLSGGSSGGSAAAVAAAQVPFTLGSDTNGSIRESGWRAAAMPSGTAISTANSSEASTSSTDAGSRVSSSVATG